MAGIGLIILAVGLGLVALVAIMIAWHHEGQLVAIRDTPTRSVSEVVGRFGASSLGEQIELMGTVECDEPLVAPFSDTPCVAYRYSVNEDQEQWTRRAGQRPVRTFEISGRDDQSQQLTRFFLRDASGRIAVDPRGAKLDLLETVARFESYSDSGSTTSNREVWRHEHALPVGNRVYVLGYLTTGAEEPLISRHPVERERPFLISYRDESALLSQARWRSYGLYLVAVLAAAGAVVAGMVAVLG
ncbi:MAG: GIDE domain-containing protein [Oscillochloridaceae bacterium umkhey_bin13]